MSKVNDMVRLLSGSFDNSEQHRTNPEMPLCRHVNTVCNHKITHLPEGFAGLFVVEESYYTTGDKTHASPHLFLFTEEGDDVVLTSYEVPEGCDKANFTYEAMGTVDYSALKPSEKFTPARYTCRDGVWEGGSVSMFSPVLKFTLFEKFSEEVLEVSETMEVNGKRTFGYDQPILYRRTK